MIYISHRGNTNGKNVERENSPEYIFESLEKGYNVEVDIWLIDSKWYFGHDEPKYEIDLLEFKFLFDRIWFHCKNFEALEELSIYKDIIYFYHSDDNFTLTSNKYIWTLTGEKLSKNSICVLPENSNYNELNCYGICSDFIQKYKSQI